MRATDLGFPEIPPYYPNRLRNRIILGIVLVVVIVGVTVGVVLSKKGGGDDDDKNRTIAVNETTALPISTERPTGAPSTESIVNQFLSGLPAYSIDLAESPRRWYGLIAIHNTMTMNCTD
jgi:hypothetical protein